MRLTRWVGFVLVGLASPMVAGCGEKLQSAPLASVQTEVQVALPVVEDVIEYEEYTGHTDAILSVSVKSRVTGYLRKKNFLDGQDTNEGDILYEIDDRPYRAVYDGALSTFDKAEAHLKRLEADFKRASHLFQSANIGKQEFDLISSNFNEAQAAVDVARAGLETARLNLDYTKIRAPMSGQLSRTLVDPGNLVRQETTILNDIVKTDKLYVYFDLSEESMGRVSNLIREGKVDQAIGEKYSVDVGTSVDEDRHNDAAGHLRDLKAQGRTPTPEDLVVPPEFPYTGLVNFSENSVDAATGTLRVRGIIDNPPPYILTPGLFVRVHLPYGAPHPALLIPDEAIGSDQGRSFVYVVNSADEVVYQPVKTGPIFHNLRSITEGLKADDQVIIDPGAIRRVRPGAIVLPKFDPSKPAPGTAQPAPAANGPSKPEAGSDRPAPR